MPIELTVEPDRGRVTGTGHGTITEEDLSDYVAARVRLGVYDLAQLIDLRDASFSIPADRGLHECLARARRAAGLTSRVPRTATVANAGTATYGFARQLAIRNSLAGNDFEVFESIADAEAWLG